MGLLAGEELQQFATEVEKRILLMLKKDGKAVIHATIMRDVLRASITGIMSQGKYQKALELFMKKHNVLAQLSADQDGTKFTFYWMDGGSKEIH